MTIWTVLWGFDNMLESPAGVMSIAELSGYLKIPRSTLYKLAQEGRLPGQKVGRQWRFHKDAIDRWLASSDEGTV